MSPLLAQSGHALLHRKCLLSGVKRKSTSAMEFHRLYVGTITGAGRAVIAGRLTKEFRRAIRVRRTGFQDFHHLFITQEIAESFDVP